MKTVIVHHSDADGVCSAALLIIWLKRRGIFPDAILSPRFSVELDNYILTKIDYINPNKIFFLDIPIQVISSVIDWIKRYNIVVFDHHPYECSLPENIELHYDPERCTSYLVFKELSLGAREAWIAAVGAIGDKDEKSAEELIRLAQKYNPKLTKEVLAKIMTYVSSGRNLGPKGVKYAVLALVEAYEMDIPTAVIGSTPNSQKLEELRQKSLKVRNWFLYNFDKFTKTIGNVLYMKISHKYFIQNYLAGSLANMFRDKIAVVANTGLDKVKAYVEIRTRKDFGVHIGKIVADLSKKYGGMGGGHKLAAGAVVPISELDAFVEEFSRAVSSKSETSL